MSDQKGAWVYDFIGKCFKWVVGNRVYDRRGDENKRPNFAPVAVKTAKRNNRNGQNP